MYGEESFLRAVSAARELCVAARWSAAAQCRGAGTGEKARAKFVGTDRQVRGKILDVLRAAERPVPQSEIDVVWPDAAQRSRALASLLTDGLAEQNDAGLFHLPI